MASVLNKRGRYADAEVAWRDVAERRKRAIGPEHPDTLSSIYGVVLVQRSQGKYAEAEATCRDLVEAAKRAIGPSDPKTLSTMITLAQLLEAQQKFAQAEPVYRGVYETRQKTLGDAHPLTLASLDALAVILSQQKKWADALPFAKSLYDQIITSPNVKISPQLRGKYLSDYGLCLARLGRFDEAIKPLSDARAALREAGDRNPALTERVLNELITACDGAHNSDQAAQWRAELAKWHASTKPASQPTTR
jgi:tetratricopeptide (TPR) repeat protein